MGKKRRTVVRPSRTVALLGKEPSGIHPPYTNEPYQRQVVTEKIYELDFLTKEEGGRKKPPTSLKEYRQITKIDGIFWSIRFLFKGEFRGNKVLATAQLLLPDGPEIPDEYDVYEGAKKVATARLAWGDAKRTDS